MSINKHGSNDKEEEEEKEVDRPHQKRRVDEANNKDPEKNLDVPKEIDFEGNLGHILNPGGRERVHVENNGQREAHRDNQGRGGGGHGRTANNREREGGQGRGGGNLEEILKALQLLRSIKGVEEENVEDKDMENFPQIHAGGRGHGGDPLGH